MELKLILLEYVLNHYCFGVSPKNLLFTKCSKTGPVLSLKDLVVSKEFLKEQTQSLLPCKWQQVSHRGKTCPKMSW